MSASAFRSLVALAAWMVAGAAFATAATHKHPAESGSSSINPEAFRSAIVIDAATGKVLFQDRADVQNPPASVTKLMTFYIVKEKIRTGELKLDTPVTVSAEASHTGGSRVWLVDKEQITVEELLYALMVPSANDAAVALATQVSGSKAAFVDLMNIKAKELGMTNTVYRSPHGLPPDVRKGQEPDLSTARDIATLARKLVAETDILKYSSTRHRPFKHQNGKVIEMDNHNHLLGSVPGCDGLKTGYYREAGFSLASTVQRNGRRIIAVVLGSPAGQGRHLWELRDTVTTQLIERGFAALPPPIATTAASAALPAGATASANSVGGAAATPSPAPTAPLRPAAAPAPADDAGAPRLIPVETEGSKPAADTSAAPEVTVHLDIPSTKK
jgi:D-alanyl-D-alanine carboxypeptidase (penicillin-binding protein 5/6)